MKFILILGKSIGMFICSFLQQELIADNMQCIYIVSGDKFKMQTHIE